MSYKELIGGDTFKAKWISSGDTFNPITANIYNGNEVLVNSGAMVSSGNGHYYFNYTTVSTPGYYVCVMQGYINSLSYIRREWFRLVTMEVD